MKVRESNTTDTTHFSILEASTHYFPPLLPFLNSPHLEPLWSRCISWWSDPDPYCQNVWTSRYHALLRVWLLAFLIHHQNLSGKYEEITSQPSEYWTFSSILPLFSSILVFSWLGINCPCQVRDFFLCLLVFGLEKIKVSRQEL